MRLLVCSEADNASVNIRERLLESGSWKERGIFDGNPVYVRGEMALISIEGLHIHEEGLDARLREQMVVTPREVIFLSRHKAASGIPTLTIHPIGNFGEAKFGGRAETLVPASPNLMTSMLRRLSEEAAGLEYEVSFEVTHHGPFLSLPSLFIEIGSDESRWDDHRAAEAIARTLTRVREESNPVVVGIGGGHYAPRFTEMALSRKVSFGHMVPNYALKEAGPDCWGEIIRRAADGSDDARMAYIHKKSMKRSEATSLSRMLPDIGIEVVEGKDLDPLDTG